MSSSVNVQFSDIKELTGNNKQLISVTDLLGRETIPTTNAPMFYIYEDGSVEKKIITN